MEELLFRGLLIGKATRYHFDKMIDRPTFLSSATFPTGSQKAVWGGIIILCLILLLTVTLAIPFVYPASTIYYKFGLQKWLLRAGKLAGLAAFIFAFGQLLMISRFRFLDRIFSHDRLVNFHSINGIFFVFFATLHPLLILAAENFTLYPFEKRYWPEFFGIGLWIITVMTAGTSWRRNKLSVSREWWLWIHRVGTFFILFGLSIHILFVSDSFGAGSPRVLVVGIQGVIFLFFIRIWFRRVIKPSHLFSVTNIVPAGKSAFSLELAPTNGKPFSYAPGQFAFITPRSATLPKQEHPFTIASSPTTSDHLQMVIKKIGDWTQKTDHFQIGDTVSLDGPYGQFSHISLPKGRPVIMVSGGIGITPMLSMLRYMADTGDRRKVLLVWSNKTWDDVFFLHELEQLGDRLKGLEIVHAITSEKTDRAINGRLDYQTLENILADFSKDAALFICGPPGMMKALHQYVRRLGFSPKGVYMEKFRL